MDNSEYKKIRDQKYKTDSKDRLSKTLKKKIQTTMIGALSTIEENLAFLWEQDNTKFSKEDMKNLYNKIRSEILDKGNNQPRKKQPQLAQYEVEWLKYSIKIPFVQQPKN